MKAVDVAIGVTVLHRRKNAGWAGKTQPPRIGTISSDAMHKIRTSEKQEYVQVDFPTKNGTKTELINFRMLEVIEVATTA
jgi:hypothetical protein